MPRVVDHEERRATIVAAAQRTIAADGLDGATMRRIAAAASCTTGLLNHYFDSHDAILSAALASAHRAAGARMVATATTGTPADALRRVVLEALPLDDVRRTEWLVWIAFWGRAAYSAPLRRQLRRHEREWHGLLVGLLERAAEVRSEPVDADGQAFLLRALVDGLGLGLAIDPSGRRADRVVWSVDHHLTTLGLAVAD